MRRKLLAYAILASGSVPLAACGSGGSGAGSAGTGGFAAAGSGGNGAQGGGGQAGSGAASGGGSGGVGGGSGAGAGNGWTTEFESKVLWKDRYSACEINAFGVEDFALDPGKPNRMAAVMSCMKGSQPPTTVLVDFDLDTKQMLTKEFLPDGALLGITVTKAGRAAAVYRSHVLATNPRVTVAYHDSGAADWQIVTRDYSPFDGDAKSMATDGERVMLSGHGAIYDISKLDTPSSWTRHSHDIPGPVAGGEDINWMVIDASQPTQALLATNELAVYRCTLPNTPTGKVVCQSKPANQGFASAPYPQWKEVFSRGFATVWARTVNKATPWATSDEGKSFSDLILPSPCLEAATIRDFAGDPTDSKTHVIAQHAAAAAAHLFVTHDSGASYVEVPTSDSGGSIDSIAIGSDGSLVLTNGGVVLRRPSF